MDIYRKRIEKLCQKLTEEGIAAAVIEDTEGRRCSNLRYLSGMPSDAVLIIIPGGKGRKDRSILIPWDMILAEKIAWADEIIAYGEYGRDFITAVEAVLHKKRVSPEAKVELPSAFPHYLYEKVSRDSSRNFLCREKGSDSYLVQDRAVKDEEEIALIKEGARLTNRLLEELEVSVKKGELRTEIDIALFIEKRSRSLGCEGTAFETMAAGPDRSWGLHAFPLSTAGPFATQGLSLVDFGVKYKGYVTDVTATFAKGPLSKKQEEMLLLVAEAYEASAAMLSVPGTTTIAVADRVTEIFSAKKWIMPHSLGHAFGLDVHEFPTLRTGREPVKFEPGMIVTLEPGLYHKKAGGVRWENDFLITETGCECLTRSKIFRLA